MVSSNVKFFVKIGEILLTWDLSFPGGREGNTDKIFLFG